MSELRLDYQHSTPLPWAGLVLLGVVLTALIFAGNYYVKLGEQASSWESKVEQIRGKGNTRGSSDGSSGHGTAELAQEVNNANEVLRQLSVPWNALFQAVESSAGGKVTLLALEPDIEKRQVKIDGETKDYKVLMDYITQLGTHPVFGSVYLQSHHVQQQDPDKPISFSLLATWVD